MHKGFKGTDGSDDAALGEALAEPTNVTLSDHTTAVTLPAGTRVKFTPCVPNDEGRLQNMTDCSKCKPFEKKVLQGAPPVLAVVGIACGIDNGDGDDRPQRHSNPHPQQGGGDGVSGVSLKGNEACADWCELPGVPEFPTEEALEAHMASVHR